MKKVDKKICPVAKVAELLSDTWTMLIVRDVMKKPMRFTDLHISLSGISTRTLTLKLEKLTSVGVITKKDQLYSISTKGKKLGSIFTEMTSYGEKYLRD